MIRELNVALTLIWEDLPRERINKTIKYFTKKLKTCVGAGDGHIKHKFLQHYQVFFYKIFIWNFT